MSNVGISGSMFIPTTLLNSFLILIMNDQNMNGQIMNGSGQQSKRFILVNGQRQWLDQPDYDDDDDMNDYEPSDQDMMSAFGTKWHDAL